MRTPYKGLAPFEDSHDDVRFFFGREAERDIIAANLMASRLTVLYGESGVGKSSVLRAGVAHHLRGIARDNREQHGRAELAVVVFDSWRDDPVRDLADAAAAAVRQALGDDSITAPTTGSLADRLQAWSELLDGDLVIILDGLEEYFLYHEGERGPGTFAAEFPEAVRRPGLRANFLIALREDALGKLDRFKASIPNLFGNYLRLDHLHREAGRRAIVGPIERFNEIELAETMDIEPELVEAVLDQVQAGKVDMGLAGRGAVERAGPERRIEAPFLQLVMRRLWDDEHAKGSRILRVSTLRALGGAEQIVRDHLDRALGDLSARDRDIAAAVFNHLVTPSGTKIAHEPADLARYAGVSEVELEPVLATLTQERVLRPAAADNGQARFEIYHDVLGEGVLAWRADHERDREIEVNQAEAASRHRRLLAVIAVGGALFAVMAAITTFALVQRGVAQKHAREADARQLGTAAVSLFEQDPQLSLQLAREAMRIAPSDEGEQTLREAYMLARERGIFPARGPVTAAMYSPDGRLMLTASEDGMARVYDARSRSLVQKLRGGRTPVNDASFSADGKSVVTAAQDGRARVWDAATGKLRATLRHGAPVRTASFDPAGRLVVTSGGRTAKIWRSGGGLVSTIPWDVPVTSAVFSPGGTFVLVTGNDSKARLYDGDRLVRTFDQGGRVTSAQFGPGGGLLVTTGLNETARVWSLGSGRLVHELAGHRGAVLDARFSPRGSKIATASADGTGRIWSVKSGELLASVVGHEGIVERIAFSPDGNFVVTGSTDRTARVSKTDNGAGRALLAGHGDSVDTVAFSPDGRRVLTASRDGTARTWDPAIQPQLERIARLPGPLWGAELVAPNRVLTAGPGKRAVLLTARDGRIVRTFDARGPVRAVAASLDGKRLAIAAGRAAEIMGPGRDSLVLPSPASVTAVAFSPYGGSIAAGDARGGLRIWAAGGAPLDVDAHDDAITDVAFSPDGTRIATASSDKTARIWDATGKHVRDFIGHRDAVTSVAFSPDGTLVLTASRDHDARLWDADTGKVVQVLRWHFGRVADASFSPDGRWILTAGPVTVGLWQPRVNEPVLPYGFGGNAALVTSAIFDPTGQQVFSTAEDGTVRRAACDVCGGRDELLALADAQLARVGRKLTAEERERYGL